MRRYGNLFDKITAYDNLMLAFNKASKGKNRQRAVIETRQDLENKITKLREMLINNEYVTSPYKIRRIYEPKEREIFVLPFYPDRIVHHAVMNIVEPIWLSLFIHDSYACIKGKGQHKGSSRLMEMVRKNSYCLKCDIRKFYPSIDHDILYHIIKRKIKCERTLNLFRRIIYPIDGSCNVPIGNYTSQWMGNLYLNELDTFVKHTLRIKDYIRYCDDFILLGDDKKYLGECKERIGAFLSEKLKLTFKVAEVFPTSHGIDFLGYRHFPSGYILLRKSTAVRVKRRLKEVVGEYEKGKVTASQVLSCLSSVDGWLKWANTHNLKSATDIDYMIRRFRNECMVGQEQYSEIQ